MTWNDRLLFGCLGLAYMTDLGQLHAMIVPQASSSASENDVQEKEHESCAQVPGTGSAHVSDSK